MSFKDTRSSDFVVGQVWGRRGSEIYLLDQVRGQWDIGRTINHMIEMMKRWPLALLKLVEDKANGPAIIQLLQGRMPRHRGDQPQGLEGGALLSDRTGHRGRQRARAGSALHPQHGVGRGLSA